MTEAEAVAALVQEKNLGVYSDGVRKFLFTPPGFTSTEVTDPHGLTPRPIYISQHVTLQTRDSLADYINSFKVPATVLFADQEKSTIVGVLDYHEASEIGDAGEAASQVDPQPGKADHAVHRAAMVLPYSEEWKVWTGFAGRLVGQLEFARFIEENAYEVVAPPAADLLETVRDLQAHRKVNFIKAVRTASNNENFEFTSESEARTKGGVELPTQFVLNLPVYYGEPNTELRAFLRWEIGDEGGLTLGIQLHRAEHVRQAAFRLIATDLYARTGCPVVYGRPS